MASGCEKLDQLVKDYLLFRGFTSTLKTLEQELKSDKDKGLRVDRMMEHIWTLLSSYDLPGLREYWRYLNQRLFSRLEQRYAPSVRKLESSLLKLYVVNAHQCNRQDKVLAFFEQLGTELQTHPDFKDWFAFPFVSAPAENPMYCVYFQKQWQDTLQLSLHNFLSVVLQAMPVPTLLNVEFDARRMKTLQEENVSLKKQLMNPPMQSDTRDTKAAPRRGVHHDTSLSPQDMVYDFSGLASDSDSMQEKQKPRRFPLSLTSPLSGRKKSDTVKVNKVTSSGALQPASSASSVPSSSSLKTKEKELSTFPPLQVPRPHSEIRKHLSAATSSTTPPASSPQAQGAVKISSPRRISTPTKAQPALSEPASDTGTYQRSASTPTKTAISLSQGAAIKVTTQMSEVKQKTEVTGSLSADTNLFVAADSDSPFLLLEDEYREHASAATFCGFSSTGQYVASLDVDGIVKVWQWSPQPATMATVMSKSAFLSLAWVPKSDRWLLLGNKTGSIRLFDVKESKTFREVMVQPNSQAQYCRVTDVQCNPCLSQFVCASSEVCPFLNTQTSVSGTLTQWDLRTLKLERSLTLDPNTSVTCSCFSADGQLLITGCSDGWIRIFDCNSQKPVKKWAAHDGPVHTIQCHASGSVYSMAADGKLCEWSVFRPGQQLNVLKVTPRILTLDAQGSTRGRLFALDAEGQHLLTYSGRQGVIYKAGSSQLQPIMQLKKHMSPVVSVDWSPSPDTRVCLTGGVDGRLKISTLLKNDGQQ